MAGTILVNVDLSSVHTADLRRSLEIFARTERLLVGTCLVEYTIAHDICHALRVEIQTRTNRSEASLVTEFARWCKAQGLPCMSADELIFEPGLDEGHKAWLRDFLQRWETAEV